MVALERDDATAVDTPDGFGGQRVGSRGKKAEQRKASVERLMTLARKHFIERGYDATTVDQIAAGAGMSKGAVYFYFKSKANLLLALIDEAEQLTVEPAVEAVRGARGSARDQLVAFLHAQSVAGQEHADRMMLVILMSIELHGRDGPVEERLIAVNESMKKLLSGVVTAGKRQGVFTKKVPAKELVSIIMAVNQGCFLEWYRNGDQLDGHQLVRALRTTVLQGVLVDAGHGGSGGDE
ncbi:MAG: TetR family transcriptional regulator [Streptosporangiales bacterium]|nr:TetR family transcriptional regulator [Streptosporangiales bacterium]